MEGFVVGPKKIKMKKQDMFACKAFGLKGEGSVIVAGPARS